MTTEEETLFTKNKLTKEMYARYVTYAIRHLEDAMTKESKREWEHSASLALLWLKDALKAEKNLEEKVK